MKPHEVLDECQRRAYATLVELDEDLHPSTRNSVIDKVGEAVRHLATAAKELRRAEDVSAKPERRSTPGTVGTTRHVARCGACGQSRILLDLFPVAIGVEENAVQWEIHCRDCLDTEEIPPDSDTFDGWVQE